MSGTAGVYERGAAEETWEYDVPVFGGIVLATVGLFQFFEGLSAVLKDQVFVATRNYVYGFDLTTWGWIHLIMGAVAIGVGVAILLRQSWAMAVGILIASLSAIMQFLFIPWQPIWAMVIIAIDIAVIYSLSSKLSNR
ncbi:MAG: hypothetical protein ACJ72A_05730 [Nocardioidaceae bacterium]|jgi:hypothetical protein